MYAPKILVIPGSTRTGSFNNCLAGTACVKLAELGADVTRISLEDFPLPLVDEDLVDEDLISNEKFPEQALKLGRMITQHDGVFLCCPEYNASITPLLKNVIDWVSLIRTDQGRKFKPWSGRYIGLAAASPGRLGGIRGLTHVRAIMISVGCQVVSEQCAIPGAKTAFDEGGALHDGAHQTLLTSVCKSLINHCTLNQQNF